jgi:hypothetical protein
VIDGHIYVVETKDIVTCTGDYWRSLDWGLDLLTTYTRLVTTSNYNGTANLHNSQMTTAHAKPFWVCCVFTSHSLATVSNSGDPSFSFTRSDPLFTASRTELTNNWPFPLLIPSRHGPRRSKHPLPTITIVACVFVAARTCLASSCPETIVV